MKLDLVGVILSVAFTAGANPVHGGSFHLSRRALTPDNTCGLVGAGNNNGYTCDPTLAQGGPCCSANGYCGSSAPYCGDGCQSAYGTCGISSSSSSSSTTTSTSSSTTSSSPTTSSIITITSSSTTPVGTSTDGCGPQNGNAICAAGYCCSEYGYCGQSADYCSGNCQPAFGSCGVASSSSTTSSSTAPVGTSTNGCGPQNGDAICAAGYCCSGNGYCGKSTDYCSGNCQPAFGSCGISSSPSSSASGPAPTGSTDLCGPYNDNAVCATGLCCSPSGFCGTGEGYCQDPVCQYNYGTCDSDTTPAGQSTITDPRPLLGSVTYTNDIYDCVEANVVALTYDDGPLNYTNELLDVLKQYNFKATFFITGNNIGKGAIDVTAPYPAVISRMIADGHQVASHTWSHYNLSALTSAQRIQQMVKNERAIANIIGKYPTYMRPPYSECTEESGCMDDMQSLGYHRTYFDLDTQDYLNPTADLIQNSKDVVTWAMGNASQGSDFLSIQHDIVQQSVANLSSYYFELIQQKGWKGVTVGECLGDSPANWYRVPGTGQGAPISPSSSSSSTSSTTSLPTGKTTSTGKTTFTGKTTSTSKTTSSSVKSTSTGKATSTKSTASTIKTATAPVATAQCDLQSGNFCGKVASFNTKPTCKDSYNDCVQQQNSCKNKASRKAYSDWSNECQRLANYCYSCGNNCSDKGFRASGE